MTKETLRQRLEKAHLDAKCEAGSYHKYAVRMLTFYNKLLHELELSGRYRVITHLIADKYIDYLSLSGHDGEKKIPDMMDEDSVNWRDPVFVDKVVEFFTDLLPQEVVYQAPLDKEQAAQR